MNNNIEAERAILGAVLLDGSWSGCFRPYRGIVIDSDGRHVAETGGCKSPSRALDRATALAMVRARRRRWDAEKMRANPEAAGRR